MSTSIFIFYLAAINLISGVIFVLDKKAAVRRHRRVSEIVLHILEALGGVFAICFLMCVLRHKNRKFSYSGWTWLILIWWIIMLYVFKMFF